MRISFIVNYIYIHNGWSPWDKRIGGSEEFVVEVSKRLAQKGHEVSVYHNGRHGTYEDVGYYSHEDFSPGDVTINVNFPEFEHDGKKIYWTSLDKNPNLSQFDAVCVISQYAKENTGVRHWNVHIVPPGYDETEIYPAKKIPKQCFYASSPDRGLDTLLSAWPEVVRLHPDATLLLTYGAPQVDLPGVINLGSVDEDTMNNIYRTSDIWAYPCSGTELYCMVGAKAQAAGCWPVVIPYMALNETVKFGDKVALGDYTQTLIKALESHPKPPLLSYPTWDFSTGKLLEIINSVLK